MKKLKFLFIFCLISLTTVLFGQEKTDIFLYKPNRGLISFGATIAPSFHLKNTLRCFHINGYLEYFPSRNISIRGDIYGLLASTSSESAALVHNHAILFGAYYHFPLKNWDLFAGMEPGVGIVGADYRDNANNWTSGPINAVPYISFMTGTRYYVGNFFNFFAELRYLHSKYFGPTVVSLDALSISAGLGFNIGLINR